MPRRSLAGEFSITPLNLLPLVLLVVLSVRQVPPFLAIFSCALFAGVLALHPARARSRPSSASPTQGRWAPRIERALRGDGDGFVSSTGNEPIDALFSRGGMASMLNTIWLVLGALSLRRDHGAGGLPRAA